MWLLPAWQHSGSEWETCVWAWHGSPGAYGPAGPMTRASGRRTSAGEDLPLAASSAFFFFSFFFWFTNECSLAWSRPLGGTETHPETSLSQTRQASLKNIPSALGSIWESISESSFFLPFQRRAVCRPGCQKCKAPFVPISFLLFFLIDLLLIWKLCHSKMIILWFNVRLETLPSSWRSQCYNDRKCPAVE